MRQWQITKECGALIKENIYIATKSTAKKLIYKRSPFLRLHNHRFPFRPKNAQSSQSVDTQPGICS